MFSPTSTAFIASFLRLVVADCDPIQDTDNPSMAIFNSAGKSGYASMTPHDAYSSSVGVLGCKINVNRVAYWPGAVDCDNICFKVSNGNRSVHLLHVDRSGGAFDISYDAWNFLYTGRSATEAPSQGGGVPMKWEAVDGGECVDLLKDGRLALSTANSMSFLSACLTRPDSFVAKNSALYNIQNPACTWGIDEVCNLPAGGNQPSCPGGLGVAKALTTFPVENIAYGTGRPAIAT